MFTAGSLSHSNTANGGVVLDASSLHPGQSKLGSLTLTGGGTLSGAYTLTNAGIVDTPASPGLSNTLALKIEDITGTATTLFSGTAASFTSAALGTIAPGATRTYRFTITYPAAGANSALQGDGMTMNLQFAGVQQ